MADTILKSFLIRLGFDVDEGKLRRFEGGVRAASAAAVALTRDLKTMAEGAVGLAAAVTAAVAVLSNRFNDLYYASQRTGVAAENILKFKFAAEQVGLSAEAAQGQIEQFAIAVRDNPALRSFAQMVAPGARDAAEQMRAFAREYRRILDTFGRDSPQEATFRAMIETAGASAEFVRQVAVNLDAFDKGGASLIEIYRKVGLTIKQATENAVTSNRELRELGLTVSAVWDRFVVELFPTFERVVRSIADYLNKNLDTIKQTGDKFAEWLNHGEGLKTVTSGLESLGHALDTIVGYMKWMADNPQLTGAIFGIAVGARTAGLPGAIAGGLTGLALGGAGQSNYNRDLMRGPYGQDDSLIPRGARGVVHDADKVSEDAARDQIKWLGGQKNTPWVKVERDSDDAEQRTIWQRLAGWLSGTLTPKVQVEADPMATDAGKTTGEGTGGITGRGGRFGGMAGLSAAQSATSAMGPQAARIVAAARAAGASDAAITGLIAAAMGEGGLSETWKSGDRGTSFGPWQFHAGGELEGYSKSGGKPGDVDAQTKYVLDTMEKRHPGFSKLTDPNEVTRLMRTVFRDYGAHEGNVPAAAEILRRVGKVPMLGEGAAGGHGEPPPGGVGPDASKIPPPRGRAPWLDEKSRNILSGIDGVGALDRFKGMVNAPPPGSDTTTVGAGDKHVSISPTTTIHAHGGDSSEVARLVERSQARLNSDLYRNFVPAIG